MIDRAIRSLETDLFYAHGRWIENKLCAQLFSTYADVQQTVDDNRLENIEMIFLKGAHKQIIGGVRLSCCSDSPGQSGSAASFPVQLVRALQRMFSWAQWQYLLKHPIFQQHLSDAKGTLDELESLAALGDHLLRDLIVEHLICPNHPDLGSDQ